MLQLIADRIVYSLLRFPADSPLAAALSFFIYDAFKILLLLYGMIAVLGFFRTYLPQEKLKKWIGGEKGWGNLFAALFGAVTPFCSCSSIPLFFSFLKAGIPLGIAFSFLITSPLVNEYLVVLMLGFFGWKITIAYIASGLTLGITCGILLGKMGLESHLVEDLLPQNTPGGKEPASRSFKERVVFGLREANGTVRKLWPWILAGVAVGALIHNYVPQELIRSIIGKAGVFSVPIATVLGIPLYGSCAAIVPVAVVLFQKGVPLGTALSFMMAIAALSFPEAVMLRRAMRLPLIAVFFGVTALAIIFTGYLLNLLQGLLL